METLKSMMMAAAGMRAQTNRMRVIAENIANSNSTASQPGQEPYRRKIPVFEAELDRASGMRVVTQTKTVPDNSEFGTRYDPNHPAANENGYVSLPNVNTMIEMVDMREAQRSFEANLNVIESARSMMRRTIDLLRA